MPNHVTNVLKINLDGDDAYKRLATLLESIKGDDPKDIISFAKIVPPPNDPAYRDKPSQHVAQQSTNWWYNWNRANWGTQWDAYSQAVVNHDPQYGQITISFHTAWSFPQEIVMALATLALKFAGDSIQIVSTDEGGNFALIGQATYTDAGVKLELHEICEESVWPICDILGTMHSVIADRATC